MTAPSATHLVIIPSYNPGPRVYATVRAALESWNPVWVVIDGSTDDSPARLLELSAREPGLKVILMDKNRGKGAAVLRGLREAAAQGYTHVLTMDSDGQHPAQRIAEFMHLSQANPGAMVLGCPIFDSSAPSLRVRGRKISNWWVNVETLWGGIGDSLYGFRVYPIVPLMTIMQRQRWMRRFDFDAEAAVRLCWHGVAPLNVPAAVQYFRPDEGGVSHFHYWRDNALLTWMHARLILGFALRLPLFVVRRYRGSRRVRAGH